MGRVKHIHFVGIGGSGMCGIAEVLQHEGYKITGSDLAETATIKYLKSLGIMIFIGHKPENILGADVVVRSSAIDMMNPELTAAREQLIPVIPRAMMLAELMRFRHGIAISGTHGKTTTTSLVSCLLAEGGLDPSFVIGGKLNSCGSHAQSGKSAYIVVEADESDASFLYLKPMMAVVTNIDVDHMDNYGDDFTKLRSTFVEFLRHLPFYGLAVVCGDDEVVKQILPDIQRPTLIYGFNEGAHYRAINWTQNGMLSEFVVQRPSPHKPLTIKFKWPGRHNVLNALAAITISTELGINDDAIIRGLYNFQGVGRRFQMLGERRFVQGTATIVDDYGHHPQEIKSTIDAFRRVWPNQRLLHVFQPHRYSRTKSLFNQFVQALSLADELLLFDIYSAGEPLIPGVSSDTLASEIRLNFPNVTLVDASNLEQHLNNIVRDGDIVLMQGAGNIGQIAYHLAKSTES
ncbi:MAG: UDP-N-acetylmuramate--L-alanine ligase [Legionella sp.]